MNNDAPDTLRPMVEARLAQQLAVRLHQAEQQITSEQAQRLKALRLMALQQARTQAAQAAVQQGRTLALGGPFNWKSWLFRASAVLPLLVLIGGLLFLQDYQQEKLVRVTADIDTALLLGDLPPSAYADPGFARYLMQER
ncbi:DUF3619 family protein [Thiomonas sp.]|jgi:hypothetical protein|uniref:DUF3619 family protein n=1 Tax=Thiomonas sp. TaxID=2047785 RepID=UPI002622B91F|nr:DUF3619 family protein [Thiomonas sp.]